MQIYYHTLDGTNYIIISDSYVQIYYHTLDGTNYIIISNSYVQTYYHTLDGTNYAIISDSNKKYLLATRIRLKIKWTRATMK